MSFGGSTHLWVNIGCGDMPASPPWTNCDSYAPLDPELVMDCTEVWPFESDTLERVCMSQVIEHLEHPDGVQAALKEAARCLRTGGLFCLTTVDWASRYERPYPPEYWARMRTGERRWPGDEHRWWPTRHEVVAEVKAFFATAHLINIAHLGEDWPVYDRADFNCCVLATSLKEEPLDGGGGTCQDEVKEVTL